jgi:alkaline phosphatase
VTLGGGAKSFGETAKAGEWKGKTLREQARSARLQARLQCSTSLQAVKQGE